MSQFSHEHPELAARGIDYRDYHADLRDGTEIRMNDALRRPHFTPDDDGYWEGRAELDENHRSRADNDREIARNEWL